MVVHPVRTFGLFALIAGCSSSSSSSSGLAGGPPDAGGGGVDATVPAPDSGTPDAGDSRDAATRVDAKANGDAGADASVDPCAKSFFCDDFDSYTAGGAPGGKWKRNESGGTVTIDTTHAHSGPNAAKASAASATGYRSVMLSLTDASLFPVAGDDFFGRMMFYLDGAPTGNVHWTFIDASGKTSQGYSAIYRYGGQTPLMNSTGGFLGSQLMANYDTPDSYATPPVGPSSDCWLHAGTEVVPVTTWSCAEWEFDGPNDTMRFWLDGAALTDLTMSGTGQGCVHQPATFTWLAPNFTQVDLGWESYQADAARTLWIDDVALGTERLGCPP